MRQYELMSQQVSRCGLPTVVVIELFIAGVAPWKSSVHEPTSLHVLDLLLSGQCQ